jgi:hypothetical protein
VLVALNVASGEPPLTMLSRDCEVLTGPSLLLRTCHSSVVTPMPSVEHKNVCCRVTCIMCNGADLVLTLELSQVCVCKSLS